jgi:outer membrane protein assembly factor BamB
MKLFLRYGIPLLYLCLFSTCPIFINNNTQVKEPDYNIPIIWKSDIKRPFTWNMTLDESGIYIYSYKEHDITTVKLNKLNLETGKTIWSTGYFEEVSLYQPIITGNYVYATLRYNEILCFDKESGNQLARIRITYDNQDVWITSNYYLYQNYLYFGCGEINIDDFYLARISVDSIIKDATPDEQLLEPELLWRSRYNGRINTKPLVYNDIAYCNTATLKLDIPIELAGININTKEEVLYDSFGGDRDYFIDHGFGYNSFYEKDGILYYLNWSIAAYDTKNYQKLYHILFDINTPRNEDYGAEWFLDAVFFNNRIYYTTSGSNVEWDTGIRNIFCINEKNGKLVWSAIPKKSESLGGKPIIYDNKVFVPNMNGIQVYNADNGKFLGVEKNIEGEAYCLNQLYGNIMITAMLSDEYPSGQIIALNLRK